MLGIRVAKTHIWFLLEVRCFTFNHYRIYDIEQEAEKHKSRGRTEEYNIVLNM